ncbi:MAG: YggT family protein [Novosphingobium sp. 16-62-11]|jgi:YggT family protein|uniref:YggT family protein n=1 Tax=Novosphingobium sp. 17-62-19 TaxID=1970406 RepID=UPI000BCD8FFC|nr:YggT family protein [Novosphingobium sp. 17-62-19]OYX93308.1 MAG: YggT family protein [Novosphingobium sp. 35-62-5]OYZ45168.1 MAG: YggT family protein [Novosphingobium sp. 16-62-11]OZA72600.1 MAG: YggT family protein [Sphingomonadales bacterium 39-62-4]HQS96494.1 YggT family protein [Novosphingobium sp.]OZA17263.1 MAG: YggT family protein [Novosphingobium sp. 17-62-19]
MMLYTLISMINYLVNIIVIVVIVQFVLGLLISFNVVNMHNNAVAAIWKALNAILEPMLRPIRKIMPDTGAIDFSPMVLIIGLNLLMILLSGIAASTAGV